jgi:carboxyl-terminal processing protease
LSYNSQLKVTTAKYYIPSGRCIQARDFSHPNEDGCVGYIPDSLISEFKTRNGRLVKDGGGITPDIEAVPGQLSQITTELFLRNYIFDYATKYYWSHPAPGSISDFSFTDQDYTDFGNFLVDRKFNYTTLTEASLGQLISDARREKYYDMNRDLFEKLETEITHTLDHDLAMFRDEITSLLEDEIISRYFYEEGAIAHGISGDEQVMKALDILNDREKYSSILNIKPTPALITSLGNSGGAGNNLH